MESEDRAGARAMTGSVADYSDASLVERAVRNCHRLHRRKQPYWASVMDAFGLGSTYAAQLCRRFGIDPDTGKTLTPAQRSKRVFHHQSQTTVER